MVDAGIDYTIAYGLRYDKLDVLYIIEPKLGTDIG